MNKQCWEVLSTNTSSSSLPSKRKFFVRLPNTNIFRQRFLLVIVLVLTIVLSTSLVVEVRSTSFVPSHSPSQPFPSSITSTSVPSSPSLSRRPLIGSSRGVRTELFCKNHPKATDVSSSLPSTSSTDSPTHTASSSSDVSTTPIPTSAPTPSTFQPLVEDNNEGNDNGSKHDDKNNNNTNKNLIKMANTLEKNPRSCILQVGVSAGILCGVANSHHDSLVSSSSKSKDSEGKNDNDDKVLVAAMSNLLHDLWKASCSLDLNLVKCIRQKLELNRRKYPVELCKGKAGKYTQYSSVTGITKDNQVAAAAALSTSNIGKSIEQDNDDDEKEQQGEKSITSEGITKTATSTSSVISWEEFVQQVPIIAQDIKEFSEARAWSKFHTPRNIILALLGEVGELSEILQWNFQLDEAFYVEKQEQKQQNHNDNNSSSKEKNSVDNEEEEKKEETANDVGTTNDNVVDVNTLISSKQIQELSQELADVCIYLLRLATICQVVPNLCVILEQKIEQEELKK